MRIRLHGTPDDVEHVAALLAAVLGVSHTSRPYPDRPPSRDVRVYLTTADSTEKENAQ